MTNESVLTYDEPGLRGRLASLSRSRKTAFSACCAERLWPQYGMWADASGIGDPEALGHLLDRIWQTTAGTSAGLSEGDQSVAEQLVPDEDDPDGPELAQNAVAAIAYAVRTWLTDEAQEAAWAARQVYEAADLVVLRDQPDLVLTAPRNEQAVLASEAVQQALRGIETDLASATQLSEAELATMRDVARREGRAWRL